MKKLLLFLTTFFTLTVVYGQLNPIKNLQFNCTCQPPPSPANCYTLSWVTPDSSLTDTLVGYNIYRNGTLYLFTTSIGISCEPCLGDPNTTYCSFMYNPASFYIHVTAVYNKSHIESAYNESTYNPGCGLYVGIKENINNSVFSISPNPFSIQTTFHTDNILHNATLTVDNCFGQTVKQIKNIFGQTIILRRDNLPSGLYFIRLTQDNKIIKTDKLVITDN